MGYKKVCLDCRLSLSRPIDFGSGLSYPCPTCSKPMILLPHRFRPPKKSDDKAWDLVRFYIANGFKYQHIYDQNEQITEQLSSRKDYVEYPDNLRDAKEFVLKYKAQAIKANA